MSNHFEVCGKCHAEVFCSCVHKCGWQCAEYGCKENLSWKDKPFNDLSRGTVNTNPKPKGECPVRTRQEALDWMKEKPDFDTSLVAATSLSAGVNDKEPLPKKNDSKPIWDMVVEDMKERDQVGEKRYGTKLQKFNGRNSTVDAYQEILDFTVYARQWVEERKEMVNCLKDILNSNAPMEMSDELYWKIENLLKKLGELK